MAKPVETAQQLLYAISLKQPWAALLVHGRKTIEVRRWPTARRGRVLIHASRVSDDRPGAWNQVPPELAASTRLVGGIVGAAELVCCHAYHTGEGFLADQSRHLNDAAWFQGPVMYGFAFENPAVLPFRPYSGWMRFFPVISEG
jgi:hypothetical protein